MTTEVKISVSGIDKELNDALINIITAKLLGHNLNVSSIKTDVTLHMSDIVIRKKNIDNNIVVSIKQENE